VWWTLAILGGLQGCVIDGPCGGRDRATRNYNAFWSTLDAEYAVFDERLPGGDWAALGEEGCAQLGPGTDKDALYDALIGLARGLDDGHTTIRAEDLDRDEDAWVLVYPHYQATYSLERNAEANYLDAPLRWAAQDWFAWGRAGSVGYLSITSMDELSPSGDEDDDVAAAEAAMDDVLAELGGADGLIVDVRANEGGWDAVSLAIARRFAGGRTLAWAKQRRDGPGHTDFTLWFESYVEEATEDAYAGPVVLLTSGGTFSAAETFTLAMRGRERVTVLGERTSGHFSDMTDGELPIGWEFTFSGERYRAADEEVYEGVGAPVDVELPLDVEALEQGQDTMLEAALEQLSGQLSW
jgi:carboxyl-terminal processing protease